MSQITRAAWRLHRWLAYAIGLQLLIWVCSGLLFAWLPFKSWVKSEGVLSRPALALAVQPAGLPPALAQVEPFDVLGLTAVTTPQGPAWRVSMRGEAKPRMLPLDGREWVAPDAATIQAFAQRAYSGGAAVVSVERLDQVPKRLGIVAETGGRGALWRVGFDDRLGTRMYFDAETGEFVAVRNEAWVWYDFFWRLHIMDYTGGEDFNNNLLRWVSSAAWVMVAAGAVLALLAGRRALRRRRGAKVPLAG